MKSSADESPSSFLGAAGVRHPRRLTSRRGEVPLNPRKFDIVAALGKCYRRRPSRACRQEPAVTAVGRAGTRRDAGRSRSDAAGVLEPALERREIYPRGRHDLRRADPERQRDRMRHHRYRDRDFRRVSAACLPTVSTGVQRIVTRIRRARTGTGAGRVTSSSYTVER